MGFSLAEVRSEEEGCWPDRHGPDGIQIVLSDDVPGLNAKNSPSGERLRSRGLWDSPSVRAFGVDSWIPHHTNGFLVLTGFWDGLGADGSTAGASLRLGAMKGSSKRIKLRGVLVAGSVPQLQVHGWAGIFKVTSFGGRVLLRSVAW